MRRIPSPIVPLPVLALLGASVLALSAALPSAPALAQRADAPSVMTPMGRAPLSFADIVDRVKPAVVSISVSSGGRATAQRPADKGPANPPGARPGPQRPPIPGMPEEWNEFFRNLPRDFGGGGAPRPVQAQGSGFVISEDGYVVTNNHVIDKANKIEVVFDNPDGTDNKFEAELVGTDPRTDIALLKIKANRKFQFVRFAPSNKAPRVGDWVLAVGNPFGLGGTVTAGIVSALARSGISEGPYDYLQIDAAVNRGNSGGPTFNLEGEVVGVNTAIYSPSGGNVGIAFAVPSTTVTKVVEQLRTTGKVARGWLGVKIQNLDADMAKSFGLPDTAGALVQEVTAKGPAEMSGLKVEDVILSVNSAKIKDTKDLALKIAEFAPNTVVDVRVMRRDKEEVVKVKLGLFPGTPTEVAAVEKNEPAARKFSSLGLSFATGARRANVKEGVAVAAVEDGSDAANKGITTGDVVTHVNGEVVNSADDIDAAVKRAASRGTVRLTVKSDARTAVVAITVKPSKG